MFESFEHNSLKSKLLKHTHTYSDCTQTHNDEWICWTCSMIVTFSTKYLNVNNAQKKAINKIYFERTQFYGTIQMIPIRRIDSNQLELFARSICGRVVNSRLLDAKEVQNNRQLLSSIYENRRSKPIATSHGHIETEVNPYTLSAFVFCCCCSFIALCEYWFAKK